MKKIAVLLFSLTLFSSGAHASKARLIALGQDADYGSHYLDDARSKFGNPAYLRLFSNYITTEWGDETGAEGGVYFDYGSFSYGIHYGSSLNGELGGEIQGTNWAEKVNPIDLFFAGDRGDLKWGLSLHFATNKDEYNTLDDHEHMALGIGLGVIGESYTAYANYRFKDNHEIGSDEVERSILLIGGSYEVGQYSLFASYYKEELEEIIASSKLSDLSLTHMELGVGHIYEVSDSARLLIDLTFTSRRFKDTSIANDDKREKLPLNIGFEVDTHSWLTLRGHISQTVFLNRHKKEASIPTDLGNNTSVATGASFNLGNLRLDGVLGAGSSDSLSLSDSFMSQVSLSYWF